MDAKKESILRIEQALSQNPNGLRFGEVKRLTGLHQDTVTIRLNALRDEGKVVQEGKFYRLSREGGDDLDRLELLALITASPGLTVVQKGESPDAAENSIRKSSTGYGFPAVPPGSLQGVMIVAQKYWMIHQLSYLTRNGLINGRDLVANPSKNVQKLKRALKTLPKKQVLAFTFDTKKLIEGLQGDYIIELLRVATIEDSTHIENEQTQFINTYRNP